MSNFFFSLRVFCVLVVMDKPTANKERAPLLPPNYDINASLSSKYESVNMDKETNEISKNDESKEIELPHGQSSLTGVTFNLLNALVGAGILSIPYSYSQCGIIGGIGLMLVFAIISTYTLKLKYFISFNIKI